MKAIVLEKYGSTDNLIFTDYPKPIAKDTEVLVKLLYTSINSADLDFIHGHPLVRFSGLFKPGYPILGSDCVGVVEEIGHAVRDLEAGDIVWADLSNPLSYGTLAQYVAVPASSLQKVPHKMKLEEAACLPTAGVVALQNVQKFQPQKGHKVLVNGAGGGIGTILIQLLSHIGCDITAVDKLEKHPILRDLGAQRTIDYREIDYSQENIEYDCVYDLLCTKDLKQCLSVVKKKGHFIMLGGSTQNLLKVLIASPILSLKHRKKVKLGGWDTNNLKDLTELGRLYQEAIIKSVIDRIIPLSETIQGLRDLEKGQIIGKIVVKVD